MDVGNPSNFARILEMFKNEYPQVKSVMSSYSISDDQTRTTIREVYDQFHYLPDPHGAVAYHALQQYLSQHPEQKGIFLETAHPVKFYDVVEPITGKPVNIPPSVSAIMDKKKKSVLMPPAYSLLKEYLLC